MISKTSSRFPVWLACVVLVLSAGSLTAGYKARPWNLRSPEAYPAKLTSEAVTIAVEPLYRDTLAAGVFDKSDIVTRGIIPLAVVIFNDNDFPIVVESASIEVISGDEHVHTLPPEEAVHLVFTKSNRSYLPQPIPKITSDKPNSDALDDFAQKFLANKTVEPHSKAGGFLYLRLPGGGSQVENYLAGGRVYIPEIHRQDTGAKMIFFEIDLKPAMANPVSK